jgi:PAS domain S-box-containing protein
MRKHTILCVNDEESILSALKRVFIGEDDYEIITANSGEEGLEILRKKPIDLIITDLYMPGIDGWKLCRLLRSPEFYEYNNIPILVMSATFSGSDAEEITRDLGANGFISVPYPSKDLLCAVENLLSGKILSRTVRVLIVEDDESLRRTICEYFKECGYSIFEASDSNQALNLFKNVNPEIVILDYHLPDHEGELLLKSLKALESQAAVLVITGDASPDLAIKVVKMGADGFVRKPFKPQYLLDLCEKIRREWSLLRVEKLLEDRTLEFQRIFENSVDGIIIFDSSGCIVQINNAVEKMLGCGREKVVGKNIWELMPQDGVNKKKTMKLMRDLKEQVKISGVEQLWKRNDGSLFYVELNFSVVSDVRRNLTGAVASIRDITERKTYEKEVKMSEEKYRSLIEHANDAILSTNREGKIISFNNKAVEMFGYTPEEIMGQSVVLLSPPSERERQQKLIEKLQKNNELYIIGKTMEGKGVKKDGQEFSYEGSTFKIELQGEFVLTVMLRDISERKMKEEELLKIRTALDNSNDAICMTDANINVVYQNQAFLNIFGYTADEIDEKGIPNVYKDINIGNAVLQALKSGKKWDGEIKILSKDGRESTCLLSASPILDGSGNIIGYFGIHTDITDRKRMEQQLLQAEKLKSLGELAGGVAHDFNNVLAAILGRAQLLKMVIDPSTGEQERRKSVTTLKEGLDVIEQASMDGAETVRRIQEFARRRDDDKNFTTVDLIEIIENALDFTKMRWKDDAESKGIKITIQKKLDIIPGTSGSAAELREVFTNLVNNAVDAMPQGGVIKFKAYKEESHIVVTVADTGIGIPKALGNRIYDPFFTTKGVKSTGLGMSVSYGIINRHRGTITVDSVEGEGTTFTIKLPISEKIVKEEKVNPAQIEKRKAKILVIEDEENVRDLLSSILIKGGHEVETAISGTQGIEIFRKKKFDLVFSDLGMPGLSGWQVAEKVKSINGRVPVVLITGWDIKQEESEMKNSYVDLIVHKPFKVDQVLNVVQESMILRI